MNKIKNLTAALIALSLIAPATSLSINESLNDTSITPGEENFVGEYTLQNDENRSYEIDTIFSTNIPFEVSYNISNNTIQPNSSEKVNISASTPSTFQPGNYSGKTEFTFINASDKTRNVNLTVEEVRNWSIEEINTTETLSVGNNGKYGALKFKNRGNTPVEISVNKTGNLTNYLEIDSEATIFPGLTKTLPVQYQISSDTDFGNYSGKLNFSSSEKYEAVEINSTFEDSINPELSEIEISSFEASKPDVFRLKATDNLEVEKVIGTVYYNGTERRGNQTVEVRKKLEEIRFKTQSNTNTWTGRIENDRRIDEYEIKISAYDRSENNVTETRNFKIIPLAAWSPQRNVRLPAYIFDSTATESIGSLSTDTPVKIKLESFNQQIGAEWEIGVETSSGQEFFDSMNDTIEINSQGEKELFVRSSEPGTYNGELSYEPIDSHVPVTSTTFSGQFTNHTNPKDQSFVLYDTTYNCKGFPSQKLNESYWSCNFNISAGRVEPGQELTQEVQFAVPEDAKETTIASYRQQVDTAEQQKNKWSRYFTIALTIAGGSFLIAFYLVTAFPVHYSVHVKSSWDASVEEYDLKSKIPDLPVLRRFK